MLYEPDHCALKTTYLGLMQELAHKWQFLCRGSVRKKEKTDINDISQIKGLWFEPQWSKPCHYVLTGLLLTVWTMKSPVPSRRVALLNRSSRYLAEAWNRQKKTNSVRGYYQKCDKFESYQVRATFWHASPRSHIHPTIINCLTQKQLLRLNGLY